MPYTIQDFLQAKAVHSPTFSTDGKQIAYLSNLGGTFQVYIQSAEGGEARQVTDFDDSVSLVKFSPVDANLQLFARDSGGNEMHQLYVLDLATGETRTLTDAPGAQHNFGDWSRDGGKVAYTSTKLNGTDYDAYLYDLAAGEETLAASLGGYCGVISFSPSGKWLVVSKARGSFLDTELYLVDTTGNVAPRLLTPHEEKALYFKAEWLTDESGFYTVTDDGSDLATVRLVNISGGISGPLTSRAPAEEIWQVEEIAVSPDGQYLGVVTNVGGYSELDLYEITHETPGSLRRQGIREVAQGGISSGLTWSRQSDRIAFALTTASESYNIWTWEVSSSNEAKQITRMPAVVPTEELTVPERIHYPSFDGLNIPAFLFLPRQIPADTPVPAVIYIHGGPEGQFRPSFNPVIQYFASQGYAVIAPNVRGSDGYGKAYLALDDRHKRLDSVRDLEGLYRWIEADGRIDPKRVALMGGSYGGYMVLAGLAFQPELWAAGVDIVGIANLVSFLENTSPYRRAVREAEYGYLATDREFLASASPINKAGDIRAPLFIIHGANDPRVPLSEAEQMRDTLAARGVAAELLVYADEGHGLAKLKNRLDAYPKVAAFLAEVF